MLPICIMTIEDESDREFMARLYTRYRRLMYDTIRQVVGDHWSAEDVVQATLLKLIDKVPKLQTLDDRRTAGYIAAACRHTAPAPVRSGGGADSRQRRKLPAQHGASHDPQGRPAAHGRNLGQAGRAQPLRAGGALHTGADGRRDRPKSFHQPRKRPHGAHQSAPEGVRPHGRRRQAMTAMQHKAAASCGCLFLLRPLHRVSLRKIFCCILSETVFHIYSGFSKKIQAGEMI